MSQLTIEVQTITPDTAKELLLKNIDNNRKLKPKLVQKYVSDILSGNWNTISDSLKIDKNDNLIDGQHRLHAIIEANKPVELSISRGYDTKAAQFLDIGAKRTVSDIARLQGIQLTPKISSMLRNVVAAGLTTSDFMVKVSLTEQDLIDLYQTIEQEVKYALELRQNSKVAKTAAMAVLTRVALYYDVVNNPSTDEANRLAEAKNVLITGVTSEVNNPLICARDYIMTQKALGREAITQMMQYVDYALFLYMNGEGRKRILLPKSYVTSHPVEIDALYI
jgi:hypothetical protein